MRHISFIIFFICSINFSYAQTTIESKLTDHTNSPLILADILITKNGEVITETQTDESGNFNLIIDDSGTIILYAEYLGYDPFEKEIVLTNEKKTIQIPTIILQESSIALDNVIVTATAKVIEQKADRTIINVANSVLSDGNTALEILNKAPGVQVSDDGAISMRGKNGVRIMLNGKLSYLSESELATLLKGMPSNSIQNIELITNPSAKYDAEGNAGIINIVLKKDARTGFNGYVNTFGARGRKNRAGVGTLLNYQQKKWNFIAGYNYSYRGEEEYRFFDRNFTQNQTKSNQYSLTNEPLTSQNAKFGIDYSFNDDFSINTLWSADFGTYDNLSKGFNNISSYQNEMLSNALTDNTQKSKWNTQSITIGLIKKLGKNKNELTADFDYTKADYKANQSLISDFQNTNTQNAYRSWRKGNTPSITDVFVGKIDYSHKLNENQNLSIGWKSSWINADNNAKNDTLAANNQWNNDVNTTNHFVYDEQINAAYLSYQYTKNKWDFTLGLRLENTNVKGDQRTINQSFEQDYTQLFPNAALMYKPNENNSYRFSYSRRINRPDYDDLNPFRYYVDAFVFWEGNPNLKPELAHSFELNYSLKNNFYITAFYTLTDDVITSVLTQIPENNTTIRSIANINQHLNYGLDINYTFSPIKKWNSINNFIIYNNDYKGEFNNQDIATQGWTFNIKSVNTYNFRNGFTAELFANYISKRTDGVYEIDPMFRIDLGVKKSFINDKLSLKLAATDVFNTLNYKSTSDVNNVAMKQNIRLDSRVVTLSLNYRFGSGKIKEKESSNNEEQNRIRG